MKRIVLGLLILGLGGCVQFPESAGPSAKETPGPLIPLGQALTADVVTADNAHAIADAEWDALDREALTLERERKQRS